MMYNTSNPAELYVGTTWELLPADKYLKTGTPLSTGGSNSFTISKANLPAVKVQIESFNMSVQNGICSIKYTATKDGVGQGDYICINPRGNYATKTLNGTVSGLTTSSASPYTTNMGSGTAITVNPIYITIRAWKRLT